MADHTPHRWVVIKVTGKNPEKTHYRVFGVWMGGYLHGDSWRLNSGITDVTEDEQDLGEFHEEYFVFHGESGSTYACNKQTYGLTGYGSMVLASMIENKDDSIATVEVVDEDTDWLNLLKKEASA